MKVAAFTGHRTLKHNRKEISAAIRDQIERHIEQDYSIFISGMAEGFDLFAAMQVLALRDLKYPHIKLWLAIPFDGQELKYTVVNRLIYNAIASKADWIRIVGNKDDKDVFLRRNDYMLKHSDATIAYFDGSKRSGTGYTVRRSTVVTNIYDQLEKER